MGCTKHRFNIHAVTEVYENNPLISNWINYHTHGMEKYGLTNLSIVAPKEDKRPGNVLNTIGEMMIDGEEFLPWMTHSMDNEDGKVIFRFRMLPTTCFAEETIRIILSDPDTGKFWDEDDYDSVYCLQKACIFELEEKLD